jgi:hemolysin D
VRIIAGVLLLSALLVGLGDVARSLEAGNVELLSISEAARTVLPPAMAQALAALHDSSSRWLPQAAVVWLGDAPLWLALAALAALVRLAGRAVGPSRGLSARHGAATATSSAGADGALAGAGLTVVGGRDGPASGALARTGGAAAGALAAGRGAPARQASATLDREFLPASLEVLLTPPSPAAGALVATICGAALAGLAWSYFGWVDIHAVAAGKVQPSGRSKVVQPLDAGKVVAIRVENGNTVRSGEVLLELDPTETGADREALARDLESARAETQRREAALAGIKTGTFALPPVGYDRDVSEGIRRREDAVLSADLGQLRSAIASLRAQHAEKSAMRQRLEQSIAARQKLLALAKERVEMRTEIESRGAGSRAQVIEAMQQYENYVTTDAGERGQLIEADAAMASLLRKVEEAVTQFVADQTQKLAEAERKRDRLAQELVKAQSRQDRTQLKAPIAGTVQQLAVTTVGQVVSGGQSLLTVVPIEGPIEVEAMITNRDIGFVQVGQSAVVKVEAFPFTRYGTIDATVAKLSRDGVDERTSAGLSDAGAASQPQRPAGSGTQTGNLVFPATLTLSRRTISVDGKDIALMPGMSVTVEIKTGQRRIIDYVLSPLREIASQSGRER